MTDKLFDEIVKNKLGQYDSGAPMHVWERIREKEKDDNKGFFFFKRFWLPGVVLLTLTGMVYLTWDSVIKHNSKEQPITSVEQKNTNTKNTNQTSGTSKSEIVQKQSGSSTINNSAVAENKGKENAAITPGAVLKSEVLKNETVETNSASNSVGSAPAKNKIQNNIAGTDNNSGLKPKQKVKADNTVNLNNELPQANKPGEQTSAKEFVLSFTNVAAYRNSLKDFHIGNVPQPNNKPSCPTVNGPRRNDLYIEVYGSPDYTMRSFSNSANLNNYIAQRRTSEDNRNGFSAGVRIAKNNRYINKPVAVISCTVTCTRLLKIGSVPDK